MDGRRKKAGCGCLCKVGGERGEKELSRGRNSMEKVRGGKPPHMFIVIEADRG